MEAGQNLRTVREGLKHLPVFDVPSAQSLKSQSSSSSLDGDFEGRIRSVCSEIERLHEVFGAPTTSPSVPVSPRRGASDVIARLRADRASLDSQLKYYSTLFSPGNIHALQSEVDVQKQSIARLLAICAAGDLELRSC
jgi:hypothetical protein